MPPILYKKYKIVERHDTRGYYFDICNKNVTDILVRHQGRFQTRKEAIARAKRLIRGWG